MLMIGHTAFGIAAGYATSNPLLAFGLGVISHHVADVIPHFDPGTYLMDRPREPRGPNDYRPRDWLFVAIDAALTLILVASLYHHFPADRLSSIAAGVVGGNFPDIVHNVPFWSPALRRFGWIRWWQDNIHWKYQSTVPPRLWYVGLATQLIVIGAAIRLVVR